MRNAHLRFGWLRFYKVTRDTTLDVSVWLDRLIVESDGELEAEERPICYRSSAATTTLRPRRRRIADQAAFEVRGPRISRLQVDLGEAPSIFRASVSIPSRKRAVPHLVAVSKELVLTRAGGDVKARRTMLVSDEPAFMLHRLAIRFGLPVLPEWSEWFAAELRARGSIQPLVGLGCTPVLVTGTKKRFLGWIGHALRRGRISIPDGSEALMWRVPSGFPMASAEQADEPVATP